MNNIKTKNDTSLPVYREYEAWEYASGTFSSITTRVSMEYSLVLSINGSPYLSLACSGSDIIELAVGHLVTEGIIRSKDDIKGIDIDTQIPAVNIHTSDDERMFEQLLRIRSIPSGCGSQAVSIEYTHDTIPAITLRADVIAPLMKEFLQYSEHHKLTRGVHSAGLYTATGEMLSFFDEIGRHNAVDKVIGDAFARNFPLHDKVLASTGRISGEIVSKALRVQLPAVISRSQPTSISIDLAKKYALTLIGRVRSSSFVVYNGIEFIET
jgi:FdhD protein